MKSIYRVLFSYRTYFLQELILLLDIRCSFEIYFSLPIYNGGGANLNTNRMSYFILFFSGICR
jgi:hypothetical protein